MATRNAAPSIQARVLVTSSRFSIDTGATRKPRWPSATTRSSDESFDSASRNGVAPTPYSLRSRSTCIFSPGQKNIDILSLYR
jgi:hypothetical protein